MDMFIYGKTTANAIAVMSYLAGRPGDRVGSSEIAGARKISVALTAKLLNQLASAGLVNGVPGPGGGYTLAKPAGEIRLVEIASIFEQMQPPSLCPFGHEWCGNGPPCPMHDALLGMLEKNRSFLEETSLAIFLPTAVKGKSKASISQESQASAKPGLAHNLKYSRGRRKKPVRA